MASLISKASLLMVPSVYEDGTLYNVLPSGNKAPDETGNHNGYDQTRADFTFSRGFNLTATRVNANGLIEKGRENLLLQSNSFDVSANWLNQLGTGGTITSGFEGYDGTSDAWKITKDGTTNRSVRQIISASGVQTFSAYLKADTLTSAAFRIDASSTIFVEFDLTNETYNISAGSTIDVSINEISNGWYRAQIAFNSSITNVHIMPDRLGTTAGSIYIQDAQLENGLVSTPVIRTGATTATAGVLENTPRIDYSSGAGALLLEPQRVNLIPQSEPFSGGAWNIFDNATITSNYATSPEGLQNAAKIGSSGGNNDFIYDSISATIGQTYTTSFFVKNISSARTAWWGVNVSDGQIIWDGSSISSKSGTNVDYEYFGNGWYRVWQTSTATSSSPLIRFYSAYQLVGETLLYGLQVEQGSHVSSYVPTYGSAATRGADSCSVTGLQTKNLLGSNQGSFVFHYKPYQAYSGSAGEIFDFRIDANNRVATYFSSGVLRLFSNIAGATNFNQSTTLDGDTEFKIALAFDTNSTLVYINGSLEYTLNGFNLGLTDFDILPPNNGLKLSECSWYPTKLSTTELATLTTL